MPLSTDIRLPKSQTPVFPDACVVCSAEHPNHTVKIGTDAIGWWTIATLWFGPRFSVRVPACKSCAVRLQLRRWSAFLLTGVLAYLVLVHLGPLITPHVPAGLRKWALVAAVIICLLPLLLWEALFPPSMELTAYTDEVDYEFRDAGYALQFMMLNNNDWYQANADQLDPEKLKALGIEDLRRERRK
jgi:hypothetical protein